MPKCALCCEERELQLSHLLPAALYRLLRNEGGKDPNPEIVRPGKNFTSSKQAVQPLLCSRCEGIFHRLGEDLVLRECARPEGFILQEQLAPMRPLAIDERAHVLLYDVAGLLGDRIDKYLYFGASVAWRAAVRSWRLFNRNYQISLGPTHLEQLRRYLLELDPFPSTMRLRVHVWGERDIYAGTGLPCVVPPHSKRQPEGVWRHRFLIPGISFYLFVGKRMPQEIDRWSLNGSAGRIMWMAPVRADGLFKSLIQHHVGNLGARKPRA